MKVEKNLHPPQNPKSKVEICQVYVNIDYWEFPCTLVVKTLCSLPGAQVWSLIRKRKILPAMWYGQKKKIWLLIITTLYLSQVIHFHIQGKGCRDFPGGQVAETPCFQWRGPVNKRFPHAATKTWCSQVNRYFTKKKKSKVYIIYWPDQSIL